MADNFTQDQVQGVLGEFKPVLDDAVAGGDFSQDNVQGILGEFEPVLDEAAGAVPPVGQPTMIRTQGVPTGPGYKDRVKKWNF